MGGNSHLEEEGVDCNTLVVGQGNLAGRGSLAGHRKQQEDRRLGSFLQVACNLVDPVDVVVQEGSSQGHRRIVVVEAWCDRRHHWSWVHSHITPAKSKIWCLGVSLFATLEAKELNRRELWVIGSKNEVARF